jgi:5'-methylthioadenosine phosphorylase
MDNIKIGIIGGTGIADLFSEHTKSLSHQIETPFGKPSGEIIETTWKGLPILLLGRHGAGHVIPPTQIPARANIFALKKLGCTHLFATGAVGSLRQEFKPRDLVVPDQLIDRTHRRISTFFDNAAVHVEFAEPFCPVLRRILIEPGVHDRGCYVCMEGPAFSTRAESLMHRLWGGDLIGMTLVPEAKLAREAEIPVRYGLTGDGLRLLETPGVRQRRRHDLAQGNHRKPARRRPQGDGADPTRSIDRIAADPAVLSACPHTSALKLAIWSEKAKISREEINKLSPLWGKYFD